MTHFSSKISFNSVTQLQTPPFLRLGRAASFHPDWLVRIFWQKSRSTATDYKNQEPRLVAAQLGTRVKTLPNHWTGAESPNNFNIILKKVSDTVLKPNIWPTEKKKRCFTYRQKMQALISFFHSLKKSSIKKFRKILCISMLHVSLWTMTTSDPLLRGEHKHVSSPSSDPVMQGETRFNFVNSRRMRLRLWLETF